MVEVLYWKMVSMRCIEGVHLCSYQLSPCQYGHCRLSHPCWVCVDVQGSIISIKRSALEGSAKSVDVRHPTALVQRASAASRVVVKERVDVTKA